MRQVIIFLLLVAFSFYACSDSVESNENSVDAKSGLFQQVDPAQSGVDFQNSFTENYEINILTYEYLYNGGGVAIGDINNDGLPDLYFSSSLASNKLYLNKGDFIFEDITEKAGVAAAEGFKTGVSMADLNNDGLLDIFVCRTGKDDNGLKDNLVFLNQGDLQFKEAHQELGLNDNSNTNHVAFLDYDKDGDLDIYLLNHRIGFATATQLRLQQQTDGTVIRKTNPETPFESDRLFRNDGGRYTDVSQAAGIVNSSFGLSVTVGDINQDGYPDLFVGNDYIEPDYVYINQQDGTFSDEYFTMLRHSSQNTMGADIGDINNDGLPDIMSLDMIAEDPFRYKQLMNVMQFDRYQMLVKYGYGDQVGRNVLHLNNGNGTFSEIGQLAGVAATDWSWSTLFADLDNDSWSDIYITNGYRRDVTDLDYMSYTRDSIKRTGGISSNRYPDVNDFLAIVPEQKIKNYVYRNRGDLGFENMTETWMSAPASYSNGAAYGDLDGDGDLDLVVNNIGSPAFLLKNTLSSGNNYLQLQLIGPKENRQALGAVASFVTATGKQYKELQLNHGFFSTSESILHFGLGETGTIPTLSIIWPDNSETVLRDVTANQRLTIKYDEVERTPVNKRNNPLANQFKDEARQRGLNFVHQENDFVDFKRERLIPRRISTEGPSLAVGDINQDGLSDLYVGGAAGQEGRIYLQTKEGQFTVLASPVLTGDVNSEDVASTFFDADGDGDMDLYVVSGGNAFPLNDPKYLDRLYLNDGQGNFTKATLPIPPSSGGAVVAWDYDQDGDQDLLIGGRVKPGFFPEAPISYVLENQGGGNFIDATARVFPEFNTMGMITDLQTADLDGDGRLELVICGDFLPIQVFVFQTSSFVNTTTDWGLENTTGLWRKVTIADVDKDGKKDIIAGNEGLNTRLKASINDPLKLYYDDFDHNGSIDPILCYPYQGNYYPFSGRDAIMGQIPELKKRFSRYQLYANANIEEVLGTLISNAKILNVEMLANTIFFQEGGKFLPSALSNQGQIAPVYDVLSFDFNQDGKMDYLLGGNFYGNETETGVYDGGNGLLLQSNDTRIPSYLPNQQYNIWISEEVRHLEQIELADKKRGIIVLNNNGPLQLLVN
jgi:hypothetical protein